MQKPQNTLKEDMVEPNDSPIIQVENFSAWYGEQQALRSIQLPVFPRERLAIIGPAGCGKTTLLRAMNRFHEYNPEFRKQGHILLHGKDIFSSTVDVMELRRKVVLIQGEGEALPGSVLDNVSIALKLAGWVSTSAVAERVEKSLQAIHMWNEIKNNLFGPAHRLTKSQLQRLKIARALTVEPEVLLLENITMGVDNPTTTLLEDILFDIKKDYTIVLATTDIKQGARASDRTAIIQNGELVEWGPTQKIFTRPEKPQTLAFISERF